MACRLKRSTRRWWPNATASCRFTTSSRQPDRERRSVALQQLNDAVLAITCASSKAQGLLDFDDLIERTSTF